MPDNINVSDTILRFATKTRLFSDTADISDAVSRVIAAHEQQNNVRTISETTTLSETIAVYKNDELVVPPIPPALPQVPSIIGTRERAVRAVRRAPRAIVIDEINNVAIAPLKLLAFTDSINKAIVGIKPRPTPNVALSQLAIEKPIEKLIAQCAIKTQPEPMILKARLCLPLSSLNLTTAKLKLRPQVQPTMHAVKAVNFDKMHRVVKIMKIAMLAQSL